MVESIVLSLLLFKCCHFLFTCFILTQKFLLYCVLGGDRDSADSHSSASFYTIVEMGGNLDVVTDVVSEKMAIYIIRPNLTVDAADDYIALTRPVRYAKCVANQVCSTNSIPIKLH